MTYVMSDIHGRIRPYHRMLKKIGFCEDDTLYILGDVIDRNPSGIPILKEIMDTPNIRLLLGNHEYMMRDFLDTDQQDDLDAWAQKMDRWCNRNGGWVTYHAFLRESQRAQDRILAFLHRLPVNIEISVGGRRILLVHASPTFLYSESRPGMKDETEFAVWNRLAPSSGSTAAAPTEPAGEAACRACGWRRKRGFTRAPAELPARGSAAEAHPPR